MTVNNWDDYRYVLAVAEAGSLSGAARELKVSQPTVGRRVSELERRLDVQLFERAPDGYRLTDAGNRICAQVRLMEAQATRIELAARSGDQISDRVRISASEGLAYAILTPLIARFQVAQPEVEVDLIVTNRAADILHREADIAVRMGDPMSDALVGRRLGEARFGLYGHDDYLAWHGQPESADDLSAHTLIEATGEIAALPQARWLRDIAPSAKIGYSANSILNQMRALGLGLGLLTLPTYLAQDLDRVRRVLPDLYDPEIDVWMLTERRIRDRPSIRAMLDFLAVEAGAALRRVSG